MKKYLALLGLLALAACASTPNVTQTELDTLRNVYDGSVLTPMAHYRQLGYCATGTTFSARNLCADRGIVAKMQARNATVLGEFNTIQAQIAAGNNTGLSGSYATLQSSIATMQTLIAEVGAK